MCRCLSASQNQEGYSSSQKRTCQQTDKMTCWSNAFSRIVKQLVTFGGLFDFWVSLAEGLWKDKKKLLPSGGTPEEVSTYATVLNQTLDNLIIAAIPNAHAKPGGHIRTPKLLDLMVLTRRAQNLGQLITLISQPQGNLLDQYQNLTTSLIPKLKARYQQYSRSCFPVLDAFLRAFAEKWLQDLLGSPTNQPDALVKKLVCVCQDCAPVNQFLRSSAVTETFWLAKKKRCSHIESGLGKLSGAVTLTTITRGPKQGPQHGLKVTKTQGTLTMDRWDSRAERTRAFLAHIGTPDELARIMGERYQDVQAALAGTKAYEIGNPTPIVLPAGDAPAASTSATQATAGGTQSGPVVARVKRKAEDEGDMIDM